MLLVVSPPAEEPLLAPLVDLIAERGGITTMEARSRLIVPGLPRPVALIADADQAQRDAERLNQLNLPAVALDPVELHLRRSKLVEVKSVSDAGEVMLTDGKHIEIAPATVITAVRGRLPVGHGDFDDEEVVWVERVGAPPVLFRASRFHVPPAPGQLPVSQNLTFARKMEPLLQRLGGERIEAQPLRQRVVPGHELLGPDPLLPIALVAMAIEKGIGRPAGTGDAVLVPRAAPSVPPQRFSKVVCTNCMSEIQEPRYFVIDSAPYCLACAEPHLRRERGPIGKILHWSRELLIASFGGLLVVLMLLQISIVWMAPLAAAVVWTITRPPRRHEIHEVDRAATAGASRSP